MRRWPRIVLLTALVAIAPVLAGCADFDLDKLDVFHLNDKKKLPGDRHDVFPNGVPGVTQGIPPELLKGNQAAAETGQATTALPGENPPAAGPANQAAAAAAKPSRTAAVGPANIVPEPETPVKPKHVEKHKPKAKAKAKAKLKPKSEPAKITIQPAARQQQQQPWPASGQQPAAPWPGTGQPSGQTNGQATGGSPWPAAPPAGN